MTLTTTNAQSLDSKNTYQVTLFKTLRKHVTSIAPVLDPDDTHTLEFICGPVFWDSLSDGDRRLAGKLMSHMVKENLVPYKFAGKCCESPLVYRVTL